MSAHRFGDNIDTDVIFPGQYLSLSTVEEMAGICMDGFEKGYAAKLKSGDVFVGGRNFGCGSSREHAPISIRGAGVSCIIAKSFARIFYRNALNIGLPVIESDEAVDAIAAGDRITVDLAAGLIRNETQNAQYAFSPFPQSILDIITGGGLVNMLRARKGGA